MKIQFIGSNIHSLSLERAHSKLGQDGEEPQKSFDLRYETVFLEEDPKSFINILEIKLFHPGEFELHLKYYSRFKTAESIDDNFKNSDFTSVNAPAIAFPYLRSAVSIITMTAGYKPAVLPTLNFVKFNQESQD